MAVHDSLERLNQCQEKDSPPLSLVVEEALGERVVTLSLVVSRVMREIPESNRGITHFYRGTSREARNNPAKVRVNGRKQTRTD